jgi:hypothetical protein
MSEGLMGLARIRTRTWPGPGTGTGTSRTRNTSAGSPNWSKTMARMIGPHEPDGRRQFIVLFPRRAIALPMDYLVCPINATLASRPALAR